MSTPVKVAGFVATLALAFLASWGVGSAVGPPPGASQSQGAPSHGSEPHGSEFDASEAHASEAHGEHRSETEAAQAPGGLAVSQDGYTLVLDRATADPGRRSVGFTITEADGAALTAYDVEHDEELHLIAVRRDLTGFQHVHPTRGDDGRWRADLELSPGSWRLFADFVPEGGEGLTLGADLDVAGDFEPAGPAEETSTARVDGYEVALDGAVAPGEATTLTARISRDGRPVTDLEPYLGAYGHLVALREGDLAYLHVHPQDGPAGPEVAFDTTLPTAGGYRLFLDFQHEGIVRTASFVIKTGSAQTHDH